jgi:predicted nuclease of predicted toxin-antitoxin system
MASDSPRLYVALYTDTDVHGKLVKQIRVHGYDAISAGEVHNENLSDLEHLAFAGSQGRAVLTHNTKDFEPLAQQFGNGGKEHFGIVVSQQLSLGELLRRVLKMLDTVDAEQMKNSYRDLGEFK